MSFSNLSCLHRSTPIKHSSSSSQIKQKPFPLYPNCLFLFSLSPALPLFLFFLSVSINLSSFLSLFPYHHDHNIASSPAPPFFFLIPFLCLCVLLPLAITPPDLSAHSTPSLSFYLYSSPLSLLPSLALFLYPSLPLHLFLFLTYSSFRISQSHFGEQDLLTPSYIAPFFSCLPFSILSVWYNWSGGGQTSSLLSRFGSATRQGG